MNRALIQTRRWVEQVVVGLSLCPFAAAPMQAESIRYAASNTEDPHEILAELLGEIEHLEAAEAPQTTLLVLPHGLSDFDDFLDLFAAAEALLEATGHAKRYQLVSFHPDYRFADAPPDDPANFTNRSPHPTIHILRRADVARAIHEHGDTASIPEDNINTLRTLGHAEIAALLAGVR